MKKIASIIILALLPLLMSAQNVNDSIRAYQLVEQLQKNIGKKVYSLIPDTMKIKNPQAISLDQVKDVLKNTNYRISEYNGSLFIMPGRSLVTDMPALKQYKGQQGNGESFIPTVIAANENQVYEIGFKNRPSKEEKVAIQGMVINFLTGEPMEGIQIVCHDPLVTALTGMDGLFHMELPKGYRTLEIRGMDIKDTERKFQVFSDGIARIELEEDERMLQEIVIEAGRVQSVRSTQIGMEKFKPALLKNIPAALGESDVLKMIQTLPGVKSVGEASSGYNVRGGSTDQNLILYNNGTVYNPSHLFGLFTAFNSDMISDAELYKSSIPAQYGGRISSVLSISSKEANKEKAQGSASIGLLTSKLNLELPIVKNKLSLQLNGRTTYSDWIMKKLPEKSGYRDGTAGFYDLGGVLSWNINQHNKFNIYSYYSNDHFSFSEYEKYGYKNMNFSAEWKSFINERLSSAFSAGYDHYDYFNDKTEVASEAARLSFGINQFFFKGNFNYRTHENNLVKIGLNSILYNIQAGTYEPLGISKIKLDKLDPEKALETAIYLDDEWEVTDKLSLNAGIRLSAFQAMGPRTYNKYAEGQLPSISTLKETVTEDGIIKNYMGPEFRLSTRYTIMDNMSLKAGFNTMRQYIHKVSNTSIMSPTDIWKLSDANIAPQKGWQLAAGLYYESNDRNWEYSLETYYKKMSDYLNYRNSAVLLMNHHLETDVISTNGYAYGVELQVKKSYGKLNGWASYSYSRTFLRQDDPRVANPVNGGKWFPTEYDRPHEFKLVSNYKFTQRVSLSCNFDYSTGRPTTIPAGQYYDYALKKKQPYYTDRNSYRLPDYMRMDLSFNLEPGHHLTRMFHTSFSLGVYNVLGRKNAYSIYYVEEQGKIKGYKLSVFGAPIPFLTVNLKF